MITKPIRNKFTATQGNVTAIGSNRIIATHNLQSAIFRASQESEVIYNRQMPDGSRRPIIDFFNNAVSHLEEPKK